MLLRPCVCEARYWWSWCSIATKSVFLSSTCLFNEPPKGLLRYHNHVGAPSHRSSFPYPTQSRFHAPSRCMVFYASPLGSSGGVYRNPKLHSKGRAQGLALDTCTHEILRCHAPSMKESTSESFEDRTLVASVSRSRTSLRGLVTHIIAIYRCEICGAVIF
jgi:hypothetical protein